MNLKELRAYYDETGKVKILPVEPIDADIARREPADVEYESDGAAALTAAACMIGAAVLLTIWGIWGLLPTLLAPFSK